MLKKFMLLIALLASLFSGTSYAELAIISHPGYNSGSIDSLNVNKIFLGERSSFPDGIKATPFNHAAGSADRKEFFTSVLRMNEKNHRRHWTKMLSKGKGSSPAEIDSYDNILRNVANTPGSISYINTSHINDTVKVLFILKGFKNI